MKKKLFEHIGDNIFKLITEQHQEPKAEEQPPAAAEQSPSSNTAEQGNFYDWTRDFDTFKTTVNTATEQAKTRFEKSLGMKVLNKSVLVRASKGYKQPVKDYTLNRVSAVNINDYYEDWVVVLKNESNKEYFLTPGYKIKVLGTAVSPEPGEATAPTEPEPAVAPPTSTPEPIPSNEKPQQQPGR